MEDDIKIYLRKAVWENAYWIYLLQDRVQ
jgi:hypothetical protein